MDIVAHTGSTYYCPLDDKVYKVTGDHTVVEDNDPQDIQNARDTRATNWRDFHLEGETDPAGGSNFGSHNYQSLFKTGDGPVSGDLSSWIEEASSVLEQHGIHLSTQDKKNLAIIAMHESGGDPNAINLTDGNAAAGHPSIGLMQTIQPTFDSYKLSGHDDIRNPVDNIIAAYRYAVDHYGSLNSVPGIIALNNGGEYVGY